MKFGISKENTGQNRGVWWRVLVLLGTKWPHWDQSLWVVSSHWGVLVRSRHSMMKQWSSVVNLSSCASLFCFYLLTSIFTNLKQPRMWWWWKARWCKKSMNGEPWRNDLGSGGKELLAISSGDLRAVYPCRFCQIFLTWNAWLLHQQDCIELGISLRALLSQLAMGTMHDCMTAWT